MACRSPSPSRCPIAWIARFTASTPRPAIPIFRQRRSDFAKLIDLAKSDSVYTKIHNDVGPIGMKAERLSEYKQLFEALRISVGINRAAQYPGAIFVIASVSANYGGGAQAKGYAFSEKPLAPLVKSLDEVGAHKSETIAFVPLDANWFLFFDSGQREVNGKSALSPPE
jgi:hypothetical protein